MKLKDVPQDQDPSYEGATKLTYALNEEGQFVKANTNGWTVEETVKSLAWKHIEKDLNETREQVRKGIASPLTYFMKLRQMDPQLLSQNMGISLLRTKWHLRPSVFKTLSPQWLERYADCLEIKTSDLVGFKA